jgi:hypothetical protein
MATVQSSKADETSSPAVNTGVRDANFNLISVLYHALQGAETYAQYVRDAQAAGDEQLAQFLEEVRGSQIELAQQAKELLAMRLDVGD